MKEIAIGIDMGGTNTALGVVSREGVCLIKDSIRTDIYGKFNDYLDELVNVINKLILSLDEGKNLIGIGIGAPNGNYYNGCIVDAPNLRWKGKIELASLISKKTGRATYLTNDANAGALGEKLFGEAKGMNDFIFITLGTGLGSGFFCGGKMLYGYTGMAGELGHTIVVQDGRECKCGRKGCLETYASATGITRTAIEILQSGKDSILKEIPKDKLDSKKIYEAALEKDAVALNSFEYTGKILGYALANAVAVTSPEAVFLFGGLANAKDLIFKPTKRYFDEYLLNIFRGTVELLPSGLDENNAAILGAAALCWTENK